MTTPHTTLLVYKMWRCWCIKCDVAYLVTSLAVWAVLGVLMALPSDWSGSVGCPWCFDGLLHCARPAWLGARSDKATDRPPWLGHGSDALWGAGAVRTGAWPLQWCAGPWYLQVLLLVNGHSENWRNYHRESSTSYTMVFSSRKRKRRKYVEYLWYSVIVHQHLRNPLIIHLYLIYIHLAR